MNEYKVKNNNILHKGYVLKAGEVVRLDADEAELLKKFIEPLQEHKQQPANDTHADDAPTNYADKTISELKKLVDRYNLTVEPTGKNGSPVKNDYVKALEQKK